MNRTRQPRPAFFLLIGSLAAAVHLTIALLLVEFGWASPACANVYAFLCAFAVSFIGHRRYTFSHVGRVSDSIWKWFFVSIGGFALNQTLYVIALHLFPQIFYFLLLVLITALVALINFLLGKHWAFSSSQI